MSVEAQDYAAAAELVGFSSVMQAAKAVREVYRGTADAKTKRKVDRLPPVIRGDLLDQTKNIVRSFLKRPKFEKQEKQITDFFELSDRRSGFSAKTTADFWNSLDTVIKYRHRVKPSKKREELGLPTEYGDIKFQQPAPIVKKVLKSKIVKLKGGGTRIVDSPPTVVYRKISQNEYEKLAGQAMFRKAMAAEGKFKRKLYKEKGTLSIDKLAAREELKASKKNVSLEVAQARKMHLPKDTFIKHRVEDPKVPAGYRIELIRVSRAYPKPKETRFPNIPRVGKKKKGKRKRK